MRRLHFETLRPVCPVCRTGGAGDHSLTLARIEREQDEHIIEGVLLCSNADCRREYPIIDGVPILLANLRHYIAEGLLPIYGRSDLGETLESIIGDCCGPASAFDQVRQYLSSYTWDHYGDLDPAEAQAEPRPGSMGRSLALGLDMAKPTPAGPCIDIGCSVGRGSFALAAPGDRLVLGVDLNFSMLRLASTALRDGVVRYPRRRTGIVYERREFKVAMPHAEQVDFWACDATALPFPAATFALATSMHSLDSVRSPHDLLESMGRALVPGGRAQKCAQDLCGSALRGSPLRMTAEPRLDRCGGRAIIASPYDWHPAATPIETWLGGHSQRTPAQGAPAEVLRALLRPGAHPSSLTTLALTDERDDIPWHVRLHDRSTMLYQTHLVVATRTAVAA
jgi:SAM-dependent methyltransferase/uncharacterized protein YbaR (Trm112 family)